MEKEEKTDISSNITYDFVHILTLPFSYELFVNKCTILVLFLRCLATNEASLSSNAMRERAKCISRNSYLRVLGSRADIQHHVSTLPEKLALLPPQLRYIASCYAMWTSMQNSTELNVL